MPRPRTVSEYWYLLADTLAAAMFLVAALVIADRVMKAWSNFSR